MSSASAGSRLGASARCVRSSKPLLVCPRNLARQTLINKKKSWKTVHRAFMAANRAAIFSDPEVVDAMIRRFFLQTEIKNGPSASTPGLGAVSLLTSTPSSSFQTINLILSNAR